jgi:glycosyltransferase involved in cell wall biosynthesis
LQQTFPQIRVCVYDNCSDDQTKTVVEELAKTEARLTYYCHPIPLKAVENFQFGFAAVQTPFFSVLADDDQLAPTFYETALATLDRYPEAQFFLGSTVDCSPTGKIISAEALKWTQEYYEPPAGALEVIQRYFNWTGALFRKNVLEKVQLDPEVKPIDYDFILRLAARFPFAVSKKTCAFFTIHPDSYSSLSGLKLFWPSWLKIAHNLQEALEPFPSAQLPAKALLHSRLKQRLFRLTIHFLSEKKFEAADQVLEVYKSQFGEDRRLAFLAGFFRKHSYLTPCLVAALKLYRRSKISFIGLLQQD